MASELQQALQQQREEQLSSLRELGSLLGAQDPEVLQASALPMRHQPATEGP